MLQASLLALALAAGTLFAAAMTLNGTDPIEAAPAAEPRPAYLALGGSLVAIAAENHGPGCIAPMLDEIRRHPNWSIRIDDLVWDDVVDDEPDERRAFLEIDAETATWRDGFLPQNTALTAQERRDVLAAFALDCRVDESLPQNGYSGHYIGVALGKDGPVVAEISSYSPVVMRIIEVLDAIRARYNASRADDLRGFSLELAGTWHDDTDAQGRPLRSPHRVAIREQDFTAREELEYRVRLLDWAMAQPVSLPAGDQIARGTLRAYGRSRPIAVDLRKLGHWSSYAAFGELGFWASVERP